MTLDKFLGSFILTAFVAMVTAMSPAMADTIDYTLTSGADTITFSLPQTPTPLASCAFSTDCFSLSPVSLTVDGSAVSNGEVNFYTPTNGGGLTILEGSTLLVNNDGPGSEQLFNGALTNPTLEAFTNLQLVGTSDSSPQFNEAFLLNAVGGSTTTPTPEPSSVLLLLVGGSVIAGMRKR
jgi:hypothetical protein